MAKSIPPVNQLLCLDDKTAIVTGASGGIGRAIARRLAEAGANVVVHYHKNATKADEVSQQILATGGKACAIGADIRQEAECEILLRETIQQLGHPNILINNAGAQPISNLLDMQVNELQDVLSTNIAAPIVLARQFASLQSTEPEQTHANNVSITNVASIEALQPRIGHSHYASSKAALAMFTRAAAVEMGEYGIRVNAVSPGLIDRDGLQQAWPEGVAQYTSAAPLSRIGNNIEIADAVLFLCSDAASWITGNNLVVDGGISCASAW